MLPITQSIIPLGNKCRPGTVAEKQFIVIHNTSNYSAGAGAANHAAYLQNLAKANTTYKSWHFTVDDQFIYQHVPTNEVTWNAGDGANGRGNVHGISIEICDNPESSLQTAMHNAAQLVAYLMNSFGLSAGAVKQHHDFSGKDCPHDIRAQGLWDSFVADCQSEYDKQYAKATSPAPAQASPSEGSVITVNGSGYSTASATGARTKVFVNTPMKVLNYRDGAPAPYQLTQILGSDETTGFFTSDMVSSQGQIAPAQPSAEKYIVSAPVSCNVYNSASKDNVINWYKNGREVEVISIDNDVAEIRYNDGVAYISARWLTKV